MPTTITTMQTNRKVRPTANPTLGLETAGADVGVEVGLGMFDVVATDMLIEGVTVMLIEGVTVMFIEGITVVFIEGITVVFIEGITVLFIEGITVMFIEGVTIMFIEGVTVMFIEGVTVIMFIEGVIGMLEVLLATILELGDAVTLLAPTVAEGDIDLLIEEVAAEVVSANRVSHSIRDFIINTCSKEMRVILYLYVIHVHRSFIE